MKIPASEVTLDPYVLGKRFKRHAEKVVLDRYGVKRTSLTTAQKESRPSSESPEATHHRATAENTSR